jgi:DNA-binding NtrC family response regulator
MFSFEWDYFWSGRWLFAHSRRSVLVVEDDVFLKPAMARVLYSLDAEMNLRWASSLAEARQAISEDLPDLVISDCLLGPGGNGLELWRFCQKEKPDIPFLMITGLAPRSLQKLEAGPPQPLPRILQKPFLPSECRRAVRSLLSRAA